ncbi:arabinose kinase [soil metagenome]
MAAVVFYISGHGFGHAFRQIEIINALGAAPEAPRIVIRSAAADWLFARTVRAPYTLLPGACDTGVVQVDSLRLDPSATITEAAAFHRRMPALARAEAAVLAHYDARLVISDAPPLACAAAAEARIPSIVISNFTWDWIYEGYPEARAAAPDLVPTLREAYGQAAAGWRLPMWGGFEPVPHCRDLPLVARHARHEPEYVRRVLGLPARTPLVLSSFGGYGVQDLDLSMLDCTDGYGVVVSGRADRLRLPRGVHFADERLLYDKELRYEDLVAAVDIVLTKPGYGIISECIANDTAMLYTSRGRFAEYDVLVREMPRYLRCGFIHHDDLFAGRWREALDRVIAMPAPPERPATDGGLVAAVQILAQLGREP